MASKLFIVLALVALFGCAYGQLLAPISGSRDLTGGYYDHYTGQYSSAITGRVYNTAPAVAVAAPAIAAPAIAAPAIAAPAIAASPFAWIRR